MGNQEEINITDSKDLWSSSKHDEEIQDMAHWRSVGRWADDEWIHHGNFHYNMFEKMCRLISRDPSDFKTMLEWGPGGGANLYKFSDTFENIYGVDISSASLKECSKQLDSKGFEAFKPVLIGNDPDIVAVKIKEKLDFFLSVAVFQHFPSKHYGLRVLAHASRLLKPGALALIQTRYRASEELLMSKENDYKKNFVTFTSYEIDEFWKYCQNSGFKVLSVELGIAPQYAFYMLEKI